MGINLTFYPVDLAVTATQLNILIVTKYRHGRVTRVIRELGARTLARDTRLCGSSWPDRRHVTEFQWKMHASSAERTFTFNTLVSDRRWSRVIIALRSSASRTFSLELVVTFSWAPTRLRIRVTPGASGLRLRRRHDRSLSLWGRPDVS